MQNNMSISRMDKDYRKGEMTADERYSRTIRPNASARVPQAPYMDEDGVRK